MKIAPLHPREVERQKELETYRIIDTMPEEEYDELVLLASEICDTPISLITLIDKDRQWFKSKIGIDGSETSRDLAFCAHAIHHSKGVFVVADATKDERFFDNPYVVSEPNVVFYAGVPLQTEGGLPLGTICVIDHQPKKLTDRQEKALQILAKRVMNLLELRKQKRVLEQLNHELAFKNEALEKFSYTTAHDLKSPLNNIISLSEFLQESLILEQESHQKMLYWIHQSSVKLKQMIDAMLEYSKTGKVFANHQEWVSIELLFKDISDLYAYRNDCKIEWKYNVDKIYLTKVALEQILLNLISNAVKYGDKEITKIEITLKEDSNGYIFQVQDNGKGIAKEHLTKIFELFEVIEDSNPIGDNRTGIGLSTVKKLIEEMNGTISVNSEIGVGSTFIFTLPKIQ